MSSTRRPEAERFSDGRHEEPQVFNKQRFLKDLVEVVRSHSLLYDKFSPDYKQLKFRKPLWKAVEREIFERGYITAVGICREKWRYLVRRFVKEKALAATDLTFVSHWPLYGALEFLSPYIQESIDTAIRALKSASDQGNDSCLPPAKKARIQQPEVVETNDSQETASESSCTFSGRREPSVNYAAEETPVVIKTEEEASHFSLSDGASLRNRLVYNDVQKHFSPSQQQSASESFCTQSRMSSSSKERHSDSSSARENVLRISQRQYSGSVVSENCLQQEEQYDPSRIKVQAVSPSSLTQDTLRLSSPISVRENILPISRQMSVVEQDVSTNAVFSGKGAASNDAFGAQKTYGIQANMDNLTKSVQLLTHSIQSPTAKDAGISDPRNRELVLTLCGLTLHLSDRQAEHFRDRVLMNMIEVFKETHAENIVRR